MEMIVKYCCHFIQKQSQQNIRKTTRSPLPLKHKLNYVHNNDIRYNDMHCNEVLYDKDQNIALHSINTVPST